MIKKEIPEKESFFHWILGNGTNGTVTNAMNSPFASQDVF